MITKGDAMIEQLFHMQAHIRTMREAVLKEGSVMPTEQHRITIPLVKIDVLWYLDLLASQVAGALWHLSTVEHDSSFSEKDKEFMQDRIVQILGKALGRNLLVVKSLDEEDQGYYRDMKHFMNVDANANKGLPLPNGRTQENVLKGWDYCREAFIQLRMVRDQVAAMLMMPGVDMRQDDFHEADLGSSGA